MKKKYLLLAALVGMSAGAMAQKKGFSYKFYGQVRADLFYNTRTNSETVDGLFYMYPLDKLPDADGNDLNDQGNGNLYALYSRVGVDVAGPMLGKARTSAKVEVDFRGSGTSYSLFRLRHAYFNLDWGTSALLVGQTWHPLYGDVAPEILNLNMGAPFQPFSRAPQVRYRFTRKHFQLTASAIWQSQYLSVGPASDKAGETSTSKSQNFIKNSCVPEFYVGMDYRRPELIAGAGVHVSSIRPRTKSVVGSDTYKVDERVTGVSAEAHLKYTHERFLLSAKSVLGTNLTQTSTVGGYGITSVDPRTGEQTYTPLRTSATWLNVAYGKTWRPALFFGYLKNLGTSTEVSDVLGTGTNLDQLLNATAELTYNRGNWKLGAEYSLCNAWYGDEFSAKAKALSSHTVMNHRVVMTAIYQF
ncbi:DcaP family trimeric outer membrane transporter [Phocaeicola coprophilus]|uniref:DcaP family trimeric outer membrane transporter n=1 Tax=Phocaeicola coprophilus TaxID=387090 RepID=UPI0022E42B17|nr:DcaP family trimeric outer membrane transporter [Phocaeicola coprophilus]